MVGQRFPSVPVMGEVVSCVRCVALCTTLGRLLNISHGTELNFAPCRSQGTPHDAPRPLYSALLVQMSPNSCSRYAQENIMICIVAVVIVVIYCSC